MTVKRKTSLFALVALAVLLVATVPAAMACEPCAGTPGYWKNHPDLWDGIHIGGLIIDHATALDWLNAPVKGDKSITMFKAFAAAQLNIEVNGCHAKCICWTYRDAEQWLVDFPVGSGVKASSEPWQYSHGEALYERLDDYNNGLLPCAGPRD
jgi:hypothetical protein